MSDDDVKVGIDGSGAARGEKLVIASLEKIRKAAAKTGADASKDLAKIVTALGKVSSKSIVIRVTSAEALSKIAKIQEQVSKIGAKLINVKMEFDRGRASNQITTLGNIIKKLETIHPAISLDISRAVAQVTSLGNSISRLARAPIPIGLTIPQGTSSQLRSVATFRGFERSAITSVQQMSAALNKLKVGADVSAGFRSFAFAANAAYRLAGALESTRRAAGHASSSFRMLHSDSLTVGGILLRTHAALQGLVAIVGMNQIANTIGEFQKTMAGLTAVAGGTEEAGKEFQFATEMANKYAVSLGAIAPNYMQLVSAGRAAGYTMGEIHQIFDGVTQASRVFGLSVEDTEGVYRAMTQIISKGSLQMEELRGQLGDRLPVAVQAFAKGMGVTTQELFNMTKNQEVVGDKLKKGMIGFSDTLAEMTNGGLDQTLKSIPASIGRLHTAFMQFVIFLNKNGMGDAIMTIVDGLTSFLTVTDKFGRVTLFGNVMAALSTTLKHLSHNILYFLPLMGVLFVQAIYRTATAISTLSAQAGTASVAMSKFSAVARGLSLTAGAIGAVLTVITIVIAQFVDKTSAAEKATDALSKAQESASRITGDLSQGVDGLAKSYKNMTKAQMESEKINLTKNLTDQKKALEAVWVEHQAIQNKMQRGHKSWSTSEIGMVDPMGSGEEYLYKRFSSLRDNSREGIKQSIEDLNELKRNLIEVGGEFYYVIQTELGKEIKVKVDIEDIDKAADSILKFKTGLFGVQDAIAEAALRIAVMNNPTKSLADIIATLPPELQESARAMMTFADSTNTAANAVRNLLTDSNFLAGSAAKYKAVLDNKKATVQDLLAVKREVAADKLQYEQEDKVKEAASYSIAGRINGLLGSTADSVSGRLGFGNVSGSVNKFIERKVAENEIRNRENESSYASEVDKRISELTNPKKGGRSGGGMSKDDLSEITSYTKEATRVTMEYGRAQLQLEDKIRRYPAMVKEAGGADKLRAEMANKYSKDLQQAYENDRAKEWAETYETVDKKISDIVKGTRDLTPVEEALNELYEARKKIFIALGDGTDRQIERAEALGNAVAAANRKIRDHSDSMSDTYAGTNHGRASKITDDISDMERTQSQLGEQIRGGDSSKVAAFERNVTTLRMMRSELKIAQLESTKFGKTVSDSMDKIGESIYQMATTGKLDIRSLILTIIQEFFKLLVIEPLIRQLKEAMNDLLNPSSGSSSSGGGFWSTIKNLIGGGGKSGGASAGGGGNFFTTAISAVGKFFGFGHTGGVIEDLHDMPRKYHTGGLVDGDGLSTSRKRSWERLASVPAGSEIIKMFDSRHMRNVMLKSGEEVLPPWDNRHFRNMSKFHSGGIVDGGMEEANRRLRNSSPENRGTSGGVTVNNHTSVNFAGPAPKSDSADATKLAEKISRHVVDEQKKSSTVDMLKNRINSRDMKVA